MCVQIIWNAGLEVYYISLTHNIRIDSQTEFSIQYLGTNILHVKMFFPQSMNLFTNSPQLQGVIGILQRH